MSACCSGDLEAFLDGELSPDGEAATRAHLAACPACRGELAWLCAERRAFVVRAQADDAALPPFEAVLRRARRAPARAPHRETRRRTLSALPATRSVWRATIERTMPLGAAALVALAVLGAMRRTPLPDVVHASPTLAVVAEPDEGLSPSLVMTCVSDEESTSSGIDDAVRVPVTPRGVSAVTEAKRVAPELEDAYGACFIPAPTHDDARALCIAPQL